MKIKRIKLNRLRNEELFNFYTEFKTFVERTTPGVLNIDALFATFLELYAQADDALEILRKSSYTADIAWLDGRRDSIYHGLVAAVDSGLHHYDDDRRVAAEKIKVILDHFGNLAGKNYNEETAGIYNFLQELRKSCVLQLAIMELNGWVDELDRANHKFETAILDRNDEAAGKADHVRMLDIRRQIDRCYLDIVERIEALALIQGDAAFADFVNALNANIERYKIGLSRRGGNKPAPDQVS
jgi:hypothetical protein